MPIIAELIDRNCPACNKTYKVNPNRLKCGRQVTCSRECTTKVRRAKIEATKEKADCPVCGESFILKSLKGRSVQARYCSQLCAYKGRTLGFTRRVVTKPYDIKVSQKNRIFVNCQQCQKQIETIPALKDRKKFCSKDCCNLSKVANSKGSNNPSWVDGRSYNKSCYRGENWESQRLLAYKRDGFSCQICKEKCLSRKRVAKEQNHLVIQCHHIVSWHLTHDNSLGNLVTLCVSCHKKLHEGSLTLDISTTKQED
jgi:hypothetical protein